jgi:hypothetical protein
MISGNRLFDCETGIDASYTFNTAIRNNRFRNNATAISINHGQENKIAYNLFDHDKEAIRLSAWGGQFSSIGYVAKRDIRSRDYVIVSNSFNRNALVFNLSRTEGLHVFSNTFAAYGQLFKDSLVTGLDTAMYYDILEQVEGDTTVLLPEIASPADPFQGTKGWAGRKNIRMTEWGPYDFRRPLISQRNAEDSSGWVELEVLGPKGSWRVKSRKGLDSLSVTTGGFPAVLRAKRAIGDNTANIQLDLEYNGEAVTGQFGEKIAGKKYPFSFRRSFQPLKWEVLWFSMDTSYHNPLWQQGLFAPTVRMAPFKRDTVSQLDYSWPHGMKAEGRAYDQFITVADTRAAVPPGEYEMLVSWQDAIRVIIGEKIVVDEWKIAPKTGDPVKERKIKVHLSENQNIRVEHLGFGGSSTLKVKLLSSRK